MDMLQYNDTLTDLAAAIEGHGARKFLLDFRENYPNHWNELYAQMTRDQHKNKVPILLMKKDAPSV